MEVLAAILKIDKDEDEDEVVFFFSNTPVAWYSQMGIGGGNVDGRRGVRKWQWKVLGKICAFLVGVVRGRV